MEERIQKMKSEIAKLENKFQRATSQAQITKVGYIYVISNLGSFGEGVVKIGMTRRLEPMDRINELGDASVPFKFDVHTMAFVQNAPEIEKKLHRKFDEPTSECGKQSKGVFQGKPPGSKSCNGRTECVKRLVL
ncbi:GIY-YIG nuclease family protein [Pseudoalteromonas espejiana]